LGVFCIFFLCAAFCFLLIFASIARQRT
jgi:hypothetical protein